MWFVARVYNIACGGSLRRVRGVCSQDREEGNWGAPAVLVDGLVSVLLGLVEIEKRRPGLGPEMGE